MHRQLTLVKTPGMIPVVILFLILITGCRQDMFNQPKYEDYEPAEFFRDSASVRPLADGTVSQSWYKDADPHFYYGVIDSEFVETFPYDITQNVLYRGQEQFNVYCAPCHNYTGNGDGIIVRRGFARYPPSFHIQRLRDAEPGYIFDVITHGKGLMYGYAARIQPEDRWAIVAYIQALQLSQHVQVYLLPEQLQQQFTTMDSLISVNADSLRADQSYAD